MIKKRLFEMRRRVRTWFFVGLPILAVTAASFLPLPVILRQGMIGVVLFWFQISLMMGVF